MPVAIGLQHATLNWEDPSCHCGPARHTEHRESQLIEEDDEGQEDDDEGGEGGEGEEGGEESDIKSNNPHLTGGEKHTFDPSMNMNSQKEHMHAGMCGPIQAVWFFCEGKIISQTFLIMQHSSNHLVEWGFWWVLERMDDPTHLEGCKTPWVYWQPLGCAVSLTKWFVTDDFCHIELLSNSSGMTSVTLTHWRCFLSFKKQSNTEKRPQSLWTVKMNKKTSWWFQPLWKILVKIGIFSKYQ